MHIFHFTHLGDTHPSSNTHLPYKLKKEESDKIIERKNHGCGEKGSTVKR